MSNAVYRTPGHNSYGVTLHYDDKRTKVSARSHVPHVMVNSDQYHIDKSTYKDATPVEHEFIEYYSAMQCTIDIMAKEIDTLVAKRDALVRHLEASVAIGTISTEEVLWGE